MKHKSYNRRKLDHWIATSKEHKANIRPDRPLTKQEIEELDTYQKMTHDPRWWR